MNKIWKRAWQVRSKLPKVEFRTSVVWGVCVWPAHVECGA